MYVGSADLMPRNIDRRVEVLFPIENPEMRQDIVQNILNVYLNDTEKGYILQADGHYVPRKNLVTEAELLFNSQTWLLNGRSQPPTPIHLLIPPAKEKAEG